MVKKNFIDSLKREVRRIDEAAIAKRNEKIIEGFTEGPYHRAIIAGRECHIFNSNDYLGLRFDESVRESEERATRKFGSGPGAVRFISGTLKVHTDLEQEIAHFHSRESALVFSSAFAANIAVIHSIIKGQSKDSLVTGETLVISDELNHRSIIDGIRVAGMPSENRAIFKHLDLDDLKGVLERNKGKFKRAVVITDGIFSMLGEFQDLGRLQEVARACDALYEEGVITIVDDSHGVACFGRTGRGTEEATNGRSDILVGTLGKGFGCDGGYVTGDKAIMDYLRESAATYIYSNPISPGTAGAALKSIETIDSGRGRELISRLNENIAYFKDSMAKAGFKFAADSVHAIQPILIGDAAKTKSLTDLLYERCILVTNINYPVVPKGKDEIRVQLSAMHRKKDIDMFVREASACAKELGIIK